LVLVFGLCFLSTQGEALPRSIAIERRDGDFDNILSELKSKGSRMRFGKRSAKQEPIGLEDPTLYLPDRFIWLQ